MAGFDHADLPFSLAWRFLTTLCDCDSACSRKSGTVEVRYYHRNGMLYVGKGVEGRGAP